MKLKPNCEVVGNISEIKYEDDYVRLVFTFNHEVELPSTAFTNKQLKVILGKRVGILNLNGKFSLRELKSR